MVLTAQAGYCLRVFQIHRQQSVYTWADQAEPGPTLHHLHLTGFIDEASWLMVQA